MRLFIALCLFVSACFCSPVSAQAIKMVSWKKEAALVKFALKRKNWRVYRMSRVIERDVLRAFALEMRSRFTSFRFAPSRLRTEMSLMKWRWSGRSSRANARYVFWITSEVKGRRVVFRLYAFTYKEIDSGSALTKSFVGYVPVRVSARIGRRQLRYTHRRVRPHYRRAFRISASRLLNVFFYNQGQRGRTQCSINRDCSHKMLMCDSGRCRKKRKRDLSSRERAMLMRRRSCQTYVDCFADEFCNSNKVCESKVKPAPKKVCAGGSVICQSNAEWQCRADGSGWYSLRACPHGCDANTGRCKKTSAPQSRSQPVRCTPGTVLCSGGFVRRVCSPMGRFNLHPKCSIPCSRTGQRMKDLDCGKAPKRTKSLQRRKPQRTPGTTPAKKQCKNGSRRCGTKGAEVCQNGRWYFQQRCDYGCSKGKCLPKPRYDRVYIGLGGSFGANITFDPDLTRLTLMGGFDFRLKLFTNVGIFSIGGGWSGGGVATWHNVNAALQDQFGIDLRYSNARLWRWTFSIGYARINQRIPAGAFGYLQSTIHGPSVGLNFRLPIGYYGTKDRMHSYVALTMSLKVIPIAFREFAPGDFVPTQLVPPPIIFKLSLEWGGPMW